MTFYSRDIKILSLDVLVVVWYKEVMGYASVYPSASCQGWRKLVFFLLRNNKGIRLVTIKALEEENATIILPLKYLSTLSLPTARLKKKGHTRCYNHHARIQTSTLISTSFFFFVFLGYSPHRRPLTICTVYCYKYRQCGHSGHRSPYRIISCCDRSGGARGCDRPQIRELMQPGYCDRLECQMERVDYEWSCCKCHGLRNTVFMCSHRFCEHFICPSCPAMHLRPAGPRVQTQRSGRRVT
jgi:hypothetical protein